MLFKLTALFLMAVETVPTPSGVIAHEWGTFTSVAGTDGTPLRWYALGGPAKLPCFVHRPETRGKDMYTFVRMETPVVYFYTGRSTIVSVDVRFLQGQFTEWYPQARNDQPGRLEWRSLQLLPGESPALPTGGEGNHYYAARATDAAPLRAGMEVEKLLFYRGAGDLDVPLRPRFTPEGRIQVRNTSADPIPAAILFENRGGKVGFRVLRDLRGTAVVDAPLLDGDVSHVRDQLAAELIGAGLYPKEAQAMLETWRDSWFEPGLRAMYIVPRSAVDAALPLTITPAASDVARVFVGRVEMMSPAMAAEIETAVARHDRAIAAKYGRFLQAFWEALHGTGTYVPADLAPAQSRGCAQ
jgi:hypothetical protein